MLEYSRALIAIVIATFALIGCSRDASNGDSAELVQLLPRSGDPNPFGEVASAHRSLLLALIGGDPAAAALLGDDFTLYDAANPNARSRDLSGRPAFGLDRFRMLSRDYSQVLQPVESVHLYTTRAAEVLVVATHSGGARTVTAWRKYGSDWKVARMTLNATDAIIDTIEARFGSTAPRR